MTGLLDLAGREPLRSSFVLWFVGKESCACTCSKKATYCHTLPSFSHGPPLPGQPSVVELNNPMQLQLQLGGGVWVKPPAADIPNPKAPTRAERNAQECNPPHGEFSRFVAVFCCGRVLSYHVRPTKDPPS